MDYIRLCIAISVIYILLPYTSASTFLTRKIPGIHIECLDDTTGNKEAFTCIDYKQKDLRRILNKIIKHRYPYTPLEKVKIVKAARHKPTRIYKLEYYVGNTECYIEAKMDCCFGPVNRIIFDACQIT